MVEGYGIKTPCVSIEGGSKIFDEVLDPFFAGVTFLIKPDRTFWSAYSKVDNYHAGLGWYNNAIGKTLTELGIKPHDHKVATIVSGNIKNSSKVSLVTNGESLTVTVQQSELITVELLGANGRLIYQSSTQTLRAGLNTIPLPQIFASGVYLVKVTGENVSLTKQLLIP